MATVRLTDVNAGLARRMRAVAMHCKDSPWIPVNPYPKQALFLALDDREILYGGAAGGGKSEAALMAVGMWVDKPGYSAGIFRKTHQDLALPGALMDRSHEWWANTKAHWNGSEKRWTFPSRATVVFGYLANPLDHLRYQGAEFQTTIFDEVTQLMEHQYRYVGLSRVRRKADVNVPLRTYAMSNPGGPGHVWVKKRFVDGELPFVPASIDDNPALDQRTYAEGLAGLDATTKAQLLRGDWEAREQGDYFRRDWFGPLLMDEPLPVHSVRIRWWDLAATERPSDDKGQKPRTAGVRMSKDRDGFYYVEHAIAASLTPGRRDDLIVQTAQADGFATTVGLEEEPGSGGIAQCETLRRRLREEGYRVVVEKATASKEERADPVASELERGWSTGWLEGHGVRCLVGPWTSEFLDEVEGFPEAERKDLADATASGFNWLKRKFPGGASPAVLGLAAEPQKIVIPVGEDYDFEPPKSDGRYHRSSRDRKGKRRW